MWSCDRSCDVDIKGIPYKSLKSIYRVIIYSVSMWPSLIQYLLSWDQTFEAAWCWNAPMIKASHYAGTPMCLCCLWQGMPFTHPPTLYSHMLCFPLVWDSADEDEERSRSAYTTPPTMLPAQTEKPSGSGTVQVTETLCSTHRHWANISEERCGANAVLLSFFRNTHNIIYLL